MKLRSTSLTLLLASVLLLSAVPRAAGAAGGVVEGRVSLEIPGATLDQVAPLVAYLEAADPGIRHAIPKAIPRIRQIDATFAPAFLVVTSGQTVRIANDDDIYHNVFSYSIPNDFDLGLYGAGKHRDVTFEAPGVVRLYCSVHESMNGVILVAPTPWHAVVESGRFEMSGVAAGRYHLRIWSDQLPLASQLVTIRAGRTAAVTVEIRPEATAP